MVAIAREAGIDTGMAQGTAIVPLMTGHNVKALRLSHFNAAGFDLLINFCLKKLFMEVF